MRPTALVLWFAMSPAPSSPPNEALFGNVGHRIVCEVAFQLLDPKERAEVGRLTALYRKPDGSAYARFTDACTFADTARSEAKKNEAWSYFSRFDRWHFLNVPRDTRTILDSHCAQNCALHGIGYHQGRLANEDLEDWKRAEALFFLAHWVGDIHQPLHVSYGDDQGGNEIEPIVGGVYSSPNLHSVWDTGIILRILGARDWRQYAIELAQSITPAEAAAWNASAPVTWAQESYDIATTNDVDYCAWLEDESHEDEICAPEHHTRRLRSEYHLMFAPVVETRLRQAGARLAAAIASALQDASSE